MLIFYFIFKKFKNLFNFHVFISHSEKETNHVVKLKELLINQCNLKVIVKDDIEFKAINSDDQVLKCIEKSQICLFFVNNDYINSVDLQKELKQATNLDKIIIFILMEEIISIEKLNVPYNIVISIYKNLVSNTDIWFGEEFYKLVYNIYLIFGREHLLSYDKTNNTTLMNRIDWNNLNECVLKDTKITVLNDIKFDGIIKLIQFNNQLITFKIDDELDNKITIHDQNLNVLKQIDFKNEKKSYIVAVYPIKDLICLIYANSAEFFILNDNFMIVKKIKPFEKELNKDITYKCVDYNETDRLLYLASKFLLFRIDTVDFKLKNEFYFRNHSAVKIKCINNMIYILDSKLIYAYSNFDNSLKLEKKFGYSILNDACDFVFESKNDLLFVLEANEPYLKVFNINNNHFMGTIEFLTDFNANLYNNGLILSNNHSIYVHSRNLIQIKLSF